MTLPSLFCCLICFFVLFFIKELQRLSLLFATGKDIYMSYTYVHIPLISDGYFSNVGLVRQQDNSQTLCIKISFCFDKFFDDLKLI